MSAATPEMLFAEQNLDQHIRYCGQCMVAAFTAGDREDGLQWSACMYEAIRSRTPEHQARITARIDSAIYFSSDEAQTLGGDQP